MELLGNGTDGHPKDLLYQPPDAANAKLLEQFGYGLKMAMTDKTWSLHESALIVRVTLILVSLGILVHGFVA